jgi:hypothetical protein
MANFTHILDRRYELTHSGTTTGPDTTTWTLPIADAKVDTLILGNDFGQNSGTVYPVVPSGNTVTLSGIFTAGPVTIGVAFPAMTRLTRPFTGTRGQNPDFTSHAQVRHLDVSHYKSGPYEVVQAWPDNRPSRTRTFSDSNSADTASIGRFRARLNGNADKSYYTISVPNPKRVFIASVYFELDDNKRRD